MQVYINVALIACIMLHGLLYHKIYKPILLNYKNLLKLQLKWLDIIGDSKVAQKRQCQQNTIRSLRIFHPKWWLQIICLDVSLNPILIIRICFSHSWNQFNESLTQIPRRDEPNSRSGKKELTFCRKRNLCT